MKNSIVILAFILFGFVSAQSNNTESAMDHVVITPNGFFTRGVKIIKDDNTEGSAYIDGNKFRIVEISGFSKPKQGLRYNAYSDEMEFEDAGGLYNIEKQNLLKINFPELKKSYVCLSYNVDGNKKYGYLVELKEGKNIKLYKREKIEFVAGTKSTNAFVKDAKDYYEKEKDLYLIQTKYQFYKIPKSINEFSNYFGEKSTLINDFAKANKINLNKEADLIKLVDFINQN